MPKSSWRRFVPRQSRIHLVLTGVWVVLLYPTIAWWRNSILWVCIMSAYAIIGTHWSAWEGARAKEAAEETEKGKSEYPACALCGGPHEFDTSIPSELWNRIIRARGLPDYLCATCILREFTKAGEGFTAKLYSEEFKGVSIRVEISDG